MTNGTDDTHAVDSKDFEVLLWLDKKMEWATPVDKFFSFKSAQVPSQVTDGCPLRGAVECLLLGVLAVVFIYGLIQCISKGPRRAIRDTERKLLDLMGSHRLSGALLVFLLLGAFLFVIVPLDLGRTSATTVLISLFGVAGGIATLVALGQIAWVRRHLEFGVKSPEQFLNELGDVLDTVTAKPNEVGSKNSKDDAHFHYLCMVHDPLMVNAFATGDNSEHMARKRFLKRMKEIIHDPNCIKKIAILSPMPESAVQSKVLRYEANSEPDQNLLLALEVDVASKVLHVDPSETDIMDAANKGAAPGTGRNNASLLKTFVSSKPEKHKKNNGIQAHPSFNQFIEHSAACFRHLFVDEWEPAGKEDRCLTFYGFKGTKLSDIKDKFPHVNIFLSDTRGLIAFFEDSTDRGDYEIQTMPIHSAQMVLALKELFKGLVKDSEKWYELHQKRRGAVSMKNAPPSSSATLTAAPQSASAPVISSDDASSPPETCHAPYTSPDLKPSQTTKLIDENNPESTQ